MTPINEQLGRRNVLIRVFGLVWGPQVFKNNNNLI